jgi:hypothetical protein
MSAAGDISRPAFSPVIVIGMIMVSMLSLVAYFALSAYAPDFRDESNGGANALSRSAIGFEGLRTLLEASDIPTALNRASLPRLRNHPSLIVLTPPEFGGDKQALQDALAGRNPAPTLIVLPKWDPFPDPISFGRVLKGGTASQEAVAEILKSFSTKTAIKRRAGTSAPLLVQPTGDFISIPPHLGAIDSLQTMSGDKWVRIVESRGGGLVVTRYENGWVYVLSDPDLLNTHGLHDLATADFALALIDHLRSGHGPVVFDVTLNGFGRAPSLLRAAFAPPFLGATLCAILAAALIGFHAAVRFGSPPGESPVHARGKRALASNAADMIRMLHREPHMAERYALTTRSLVLRALGVRRQIELRESDALFKALERDGRTTFAALLAEARYVNSRADLLALARKLYEWRQEILHAR